MLTDSFDPVRPGDFILEDVANVDGQIPDACYSLMIRNIAGLQAENEKVFEVKVLNEKKKSESCITLAAVDSLK